MKSYKGITFREGYKSFPEFKKELEGVHIFRHMRPEVREKELKRAYKIATGKNAKDELQSSNKESGKTDTSADRKRTVRGDKKD